MWLDPHRRAKRFGLPLPGPALRALLPTGAVLPRAGEDLDVGKQRAAASLAAHFPARRTCVRLCRCTGAGPDRVRALLQVARLIDDLHRIAVMQMLDDETAEAVANRVGIPLGPRDSNTRRRPRASAA